MASYYRQLSADSKMKSLKNKISFVGPEGSKALAKKTGIILIYFYLNIHDFSEWLITGSIPADINQFRSHTEKIIFCHLIQRTSKNLESSKRVKD